MVDEECARAILYSFGKTHSSLMLVEDFRKVVRSIFLRSEGRQAVVRVSKKDVLMHKSRMEIEELSPKSRM